jgi:hypothetical protein
MPSEFSQVSFALRWDLTSQESICLCVIAFVAGVLYPVHIGAVEQTPVLLFGVRCSKFIAFGG